MVAKWPLLDLTMADLAVYFGRSERRVYEQAKSLKLPVGCPKGAEYLTVAARRAGMTRPSLREALRVVGAKEYVGRTPTSKRSVKRARVVVYKSDVNKAVANYCKLEDLEVAARRLGVCSKDLRKAARASKGIGPPPPRYRRWRLLPETWDTVLAKHRKNVRDKRARKCRRGASVRIRMKRKSK